MKRMNRRSLSTESLTVVCNWCVSNEGTPLATAWWAACELIGEVDTTGIRDQVLSRWKGKGFSFFLAKGGPVCPIYETTDMVFKMRDHIGIIIHDMIRRDERRSKTVPK